MTLLIRENRNFRLLISGAGLANLSDGIGVLAFPWLATLITTDPRALALVAFATRAPWFLWSLPVGVLTDRVDRRRLMVRADMVRMLLALAVVALCLTGPASADGTKTVLMITVLSLLAFLMGTAEVFRDNAAQTALPSLVAKNRLEEANGQIWSAEQVMGQFVGPPLAGFLIALAVPAPFLFEATGFALAAWAVWSIAMPAREVANAHTGFWIEIGEGWKWLKRHKAILQLALMLGGLNATHMAGFTVLVLYAQDILGLGAVGFGLLLTAGAAGGVAGGIFCPWIVSRMGGNLSLKVALSIMPLPYLGLSLLTSVPLTAGLLFLETFVAVLWNIVTVSYRQRAIPDVLLGRVNAIYRFFGWGMMPFGALAGGWIMALAEPEMGREDALRLVFLTASLAFVAFFAYGLAWLRLPATK